MGTVTTDEVLWGYCSTTPISSILDFLRPRMTNKGEEEETTAGQGQPPLRPTNISTQNDPSTGTHISSIWHLLRLSTVPPLGAKPLSLYPTREGEEDRTEHTADITVPIGCGTHIRHTPPKDTKLPVASLLPPRFSASPDLPSQHLSVGVSNNTPFSSSGRSATPQGTERAALNAQKTT